MTALALVSIAFSIIVHGWLTGKGIDMSQLDDDVKALTDEVTNANSQLEAAVAYIQGVPNLVATAVNEALASAGVEAAAAQAAVEAATASVQAETQKVTDAIAANQPAPTPAAPASTQTQP